jgi:carbamoyl-phosphate synthase large subunit
MASTGEIASFGSTIQEAYWAALLSQTGFKIPRPNSGVLLGGDVTKPEMTTVAEGLTKLGFKLYCSSSDIEEFLNSIPYVSAQRIFFPTKDKRKLREVFDEYDIECVINLAKGRGTSATDEDYVARRYVCSLALRARGLMTVTGTLWTLDCPFSTMLVVRNYSLRHWP